jgi:hypothetical protein
MSWVAVISGVVTILVAILKLVTEERQKTQTGDASYAKKKEEFDQALAGNDAAAIDVAIDAVLPPPEGGDHSK